MWLEQMKYTVSNTFDGGSTHVDMCMCFRVTMTVDTTIDRPTIGENICCTLFTLFFWYIIIHSQHQLVFVLITHVQNVRAQSMLILYTVTKSQYSHNIVW